MPDGNAIPALHAHFRFQWEPAQDAYVLLYPEGMIKLNGSAGEILACCDGARSISEIVGLLQNKFPDAPAQALSDDTLEFFTLAHEKGWIELG